VEPPSTRVNNYGVRQLVAHLCSRGRLEEAAALVTDEAFRTAKLALADGLAELQADLHTVERACRAAGRADLVEKVSQVQAALRTSPPTASPADPDVQLVSRIAISADGRTMAAGIEAGAVVVWDVPSGTERFRLRGLSALPTCVAFAADGRRVAAGAQNGTVCVWELSRGIGTKPQAASTRPIPAIRFDSAGQVVVRTSDASTAWVAVTGAVRHGDVEEVRGAVRLHQRRADAQHRRGPRPLPRDLAVLDDRRVLAQRREPHHVGRQNTGGTKRPGQPVDPRL
jgi:hypothetical protein